MSDEEIEVPVFFQRRGELYRGMAQFHAKRCHIALTGRQLKTGGWDYALAYKEMGDDKFAIRQDQLEELKNGQAILVDFGDGELISVQLGEYSPPSDDRKQRDLFDS